jgi:hypothetical protein
MRDGETACIVTHGDVDSVVRYIIEGASRSDRELKRGVSGSAALAFSKHVVVPRLIETLQGVSDSPVRYDSAVADSASHSS